MKTIRVNERSRDIVKEAALSRDTLLGRKQLDVSPSDRIGSRYPFNKLALVMERSKLLLAKLLLSHSWQKFLGTLGHFVRLNIFRRSNKQAFQNTCSGCRFRKLVVVDYLPGRLTSFLRLRCVRRSIASLGARKKSTDAPP
jgi:hypothetical protein